MVCLTDNGIEGVRRLCFSTQVNTLGFFCPKRDEGQFSEDVTPIAKTPVEVIVRVIDLGMKRSL